MSAADSDHFLGEIVIRGVTGAGRTFRPSDWAERLASVASHMGADNRLNYSPNVRPASRDGIRCVVINPRVSEPWASPRSRDAPTQNKTARLGRAVCGESPGTIRPWP